MVLDFEYGINTGNRFLEFVDHDEEPEAFIAAQTKTDDKQKKTTTTTKDTKQTTKKVTTKTTTTTTTTNTKNNKENVNTKSSAGDQRRPQSTSVTTAFSDNNNQQIRGDSARGARGGPRRGGPNFDGSGRGRSQRFNKFEGQNQSSTNESSAADQAGDSFNAEAGSRGGRGRGGPRRGNFEGNRGTGGRGRGRGGRGNFNNRSQDEGAPDSTWQASSDSNFDNTRSQPNRDFDQDVSPTDRPFEPDNTRRNNRGSHRGRSYRGHGDRDVAEGGQEDSRTTRRQFDRQPRSFTSSVKAIEKKDGEGAHNWGKQTENPEEHPITDEINEPTTQAAAPKDWAQQVEEAEIQMTLDEYKKQMEAKRRANQERLPQFNTRTAGEGEDPKLWQKFDREYRKKVDAEASEGEEEEGSGIEENESEDEVEEEQLTGKKKLITIPLRFKPIDIPRGSAGSRGGQRRGGGRFRQNRDEQRSTSPSQAQQSPSSQQYDDQQGSYRGGPRGARRPNRIPRQGRGNADPNALALDNPVDFPTLAKQ